MGRCGSCGDPAGGLPHGHGRGPALAVQEVLGLDPLSGVAVVFLAKLAGWIEVLIWDRTGIVQFYKRLEGAKFVRPQVLVGVMKFSPKQFSTAFEGSD